MKLIARLSGAMFTVALLITSSIQSSYARELWEDDWIEVRSPSFIINSNLPDDETIELVVDLENFRRAISLVSNIERVEERIPTRLFLFRKRPSDLSPSSSFAGYFAPGMRENLGVIVRTSDDSEQILKHEYTHFLTYNRDQLIYPLWFNEGFAEVLSTLRVNGLNIDYGHDIPWRTQWLRARNWIPFRTVLSTTGLSSLSNEQTALLYAQSWLMVHYLTMGRKNVNFKEEMGNYIQLSESGTSPVDAFEQAFDMNMVKLENRLSRYGPRMRITRIRLKEAFPVIETSTRNLQTAEIATELGKIALRVTGREKAEQFIDAALTADPAYAPAQIAHALALDDAKDFEDSAKIYQSAIEKNPGQAEPELDYAVHLFTHAFYTEDDEKRAELLTDARRHFARSYKIDPTIPQTLALNGATYLFNGQDNSRALGSLSAAQQMIPSDRLLNELLARAYALEGDLQTAKVVTQRLMAWADKDSAERLSKLMHALESTPPNLDEIYLNPDDE